MAIRLKNIIINAFLILMIFNITCCYAQMNYADPSEQKELNTIENQLFNQNFSNESTCHRLDRIENIMLGKISTEPESERLNQLVKLINSNKQPINPNMYSVQSFNDNQNPGKDDSVTDYPTVTELENLAFNKDFTNENIYARLTRLENKIFGSSFPNESLMDRVDRLKKALMSGKLSSPENPSRNANKFSPVVASGTIYSTVSDLESHVFDRTFDNELVSERVQRLEKKLFGACQSGEIDQRLKRLCNAVNNSPEPNNNNFAYRTNSNVAPNYQTHRTQNSSNMVSMGSGFDSDFFNDKWDDDGFFSDNQSNGNNQVAGQPKVSAGSGIMGLVGMAALPLAMTFLGQKFKFLSPQNNYYPPYPPYPNYPAYSAYPSYPYPAPAYNYPNPAYPAQYTNYPRPVYVYPQTNVYNPYGNPYYANAIPQTYQSTWNVFGTGATILPY